MTQNIGPMLKALFLTIISVLWELLKSVGEPLYTTLIKMLLVTSVIYGISHYIPHHLPYINHISFLGWFCIISLYRLITARYDDFDINTDNTQDIPTPIPTQDVDMMEETTTLPDTMSVRSNTYTGIGNIIPKKVEPPPTTSPDKDNTNTNKDKNRDNDDTEYSTRQ